YCTKSSGNPENSSRSTVEASEGHSSVPLPPRPQLMERCDSAPSKATQTTLDETACSSFLPPRERLRGPNAPLTDPLELRKFDQTSYHGLSDYFTSETEKT